MSSEPGMWHIGPLYFSPAVLLLPVVAGLVVWGLASVCMRHRATRLPILLIPIIVGGLLSYGGLSAPSGYAAAYAGGAAWILSGITALGSMLLLPTGRTRRAGALGLASAAMILATFYIVFLGGHRLGLYDWWGDEPVTIPRVEPR